MRNASQRRSKNNNRCRSRAIIDRRKCLLLLEKTWYLDLKSLQSRSKSLISTKKSLISQRLSQKRFLSYTEESKLSANHYRRRLKRSTKVFTWTISTLHCTRARLMKSINLYFNRWSKSFKTSARSTLTIWVANSSKTMRLSNSKKLLSINFRTRFSPSRTTLSKNWMLSWDSSRLRRKKLPRKRRQHKKVKQMSKSRLLKLVKQNLKLSLR